MKRIFVLLILSFMFPMMINSKEIIEEIKYDTTSDKTYCSSIVKSNDNGYAIFVENENGEMFLTKYDNDEMVTFEKEIDAHTTIADAIVADDGSYILAGNISDVYFYIKKINESGEEIWEYKTWSSGIGSISKVVEGKNGNVYVVGSVGPGAEWSSTSEFEGEVKL